MQEKILNFYKNHNRKESMLLSMFYAYIFMLTLFCIISLWVEQYQDIVVNLIAISLSVIILKKYLNGINSLKATAVWILIVMELHSGIMIASNHHNNVSIIFPFIYIAPYFFFFSMKEALLAVFIQFIYWGIITLIALKLHPQMHVLITPLSYLNNLNVTIIIITIGIFYQLITESSYQKLQNANKEKDRLLKIIHHKIRNNLNFVSSLLGLQIRHIQKHPQQDNIDTLKNAKSRIHSIALSHRALYDEKDIVQHIDPKRYLQNLFIFINEIYKRDINLIYKSDNILFLEETTHNLGLILNELFHKSLKNSDKKRDIVVELSKQDGRYLLFYLDKDIKTKFKKESFAYKLINLIADQLEATMTLSTDSGLSCKMWFR